MTECPWSRHWSRSLVVAESACPAAVPEFLVRFAGSMDGAPVAGWMPVPAGVAGGRDAQVGTGGTPEWTIRWRRLVLCAVAVVAGIRSIRAIAEHVGTPGAPGVDAVPALRRPGPTPAVEVDDLAAVTGADRSRWTSRSAPGWAAASWTCGPRRGRRPATADAAADQRRRQDRARSPHRRRQARTCWPPPFAGWYWPRPRSG